MPKWVQEYEKKKKKSTEKKAQCAINLRVLASESDTDDIGIAFTLTNRKLPINPECDNTLLRWNTSDREGRALVVGHASEFFYAV